MLNCENEQFHIKAKPGQIGKYCLLPGDPGRCKQIASYLENPYPLVCNREFNLWNGTLEGRLITVCSTGIGGPSTAIALEELTACGADTFIRVGTCGGIALSVKAGDVVIASGAVRQDGTSREYAPPEFPAVADTEVLFSLCRAVKQLEYPFHTGVVQSKDSFYGQHRPSRMPTAPELTYKWEAWKKLGVLCSEMEAAALFTASASLGVHAGAVFHVIWNQERANAGLDKDCEEMHDVSCAIRTAIEALRILIRES